MLDLKTLEPEQLNRQEVFDEIRARVFDYSFGSDMGDTLDFVKQLDILLNINHSLQSEDSHLYREYQKIVILLKYYAFPLLMEKEIFELFKNNLLLAFEFGVDLPDKITMLYMLYPSDQEIDKIRNDLLNALTQNTEKIGRQEIKRGARAISYPPMIKNWLGDFALHFTTDLPLGNLEEITYINENSNTKTLDDKEKDLLLKTIRLYDYLRFPVAELEKVKATGHLVGIATRPSLTLPTMPPDEKEEEVIQKTIGEEPAPLKAPNLWDAFSEYIDFKTQVLRTEDQLMTKTQGNMTSIKRELSNAALSGDKNKLVACLKLLARSGILQTVLADHAAWFAAIADFMRKKYKTIYGEQAVEQMINNMRQDPTSSVLLSEFLQYLLKERLKLKENDSALIGLEFGQMLYGESQRFCYGNEATGQFEWVKHKIENGKLANELT